MSITAIVPMRHDSERVRGKNYRRLGDKPLYHHIVDTLLACSSVAEIIIDTDSPLIHEEAARVFPDVRVVERPENLRAGETAMNDVLAHTLTHVRAEAVLQTHSTNPFLSAKTIEHAIAVLAADRDADSAFGVSRLQARLWSSGARPVNHDPAVLMRTQDLDPIYLENSCFYLFDRSVFEATNNRIGRAPLMVEVPKREAVDIDDAKLETAKKFGDEQVLVWRRSYDTPPPALAIRAWRKCRARSPAAGR